MKASRVCLGVFIGAHGVRGAAKIKSFTETPENVAAYGPVQSEDGARTFRLKIVREAKPGVLIVTAPEIKNREDAAALNQTKLYVPRDRLPALDDEDEYYLEDLVGMAATTETGAPAGEIAAVHDFGAGDLLELRGIPGVKGAHLVPFTREAVPEIDLQFGCVTIAMAYLPTPDDGDPAAGSQ